MSENHIKELRCCLSEDRAQFGQLPAVGTSAEVHHRAKRSSRVQASEATKVLHDKEKDVDRKALDWLVQNFFKRVYSSHSSHDGPVEERDEVWMSTSLRIESNKNLIREQRRQLRELVKERNLLVHRLLANFDPDSVESCEKLIQLLDAQVDRLVPHLSVPHGHH